jgi:hypothetical protein
LGVDAHLVYETLNFSGAFAMSSVSTLGIGVNVIFACFLLSIMIFCWKKRLNNPSSPSSSSAKHLMNKNQVEEGEVWDSRHLFTLFLQKEAHTPGLHKKLHNTECKGG